MSIDGFTPDDRQAFVAYDRRLARRTADWVARVADRWHVQIVGLEHLPAGRALLVANHAFGWDAALAIALIERATSREVFALGEHAWWRFPLLRRLAAAVGVVDGTPINVDRLLEADRLVVVLPGGLRESMKPRELRYRLLWGHRYGFVRAAIRNRAPLVPLACIGADDVFELVGDPFRRGAKWLHNAGVPIPRPARWLPIPHRARLRYVIGEPIAVDGIDEHDEARVHRLRREVEGALHEMIEAELAKRAGFDAS